MTLGFKSHLVRNGPWFFQPGRMHSSKCHMLLLHLRLEVCIHVCFVPCYVHVLYFPGFPNPPGPGLVCFLLVKATHCWCWNCGPVAIITTHSEKVCEITLKYCKSPYIRCRKFSQFFSFRLFIAGNFCDQPYSANTRPTVLVSNTIFTAEWIREFDVTFESCENFMLVKKRWFRVHSLRSVHTMLSCCCQRLQSSSTLLPHHTLHLHKQSSKNYRYRPWQTDLETHVFWELRIYYSWVLMTS